jgi:hypothetical protein
VRPIGRASNLPRKSRIPDRDAISRAARAQALPSAACAGADDLEIRLFCSLSGDDMDIETIAVAGWKRSAEVITVTYVPGT